MCRIPTCQGSVGEVLQLAALPLAIDDAEVDFDGVAERRVSVGRHLNKQHVLQHRDLLCSEPGSF